MVAFHEAVRLLGDVDEAEEREIRHIRERYAARRAELIAALDAEHPACTCGHRASEHEGDGCWHSSCDRPECSCTCECEQYTPDRTDEEDRP